MRWTMLLLLCLGACGDDTESSTCDSGTGDACDGGTGGFGDNGTGGVGGAGGTSDPVPARDRREDYDPDFPRGGEAMSLCTDDAHCVAPLECYGAGHYCAAACKDDVDCPDGQSCYLRGGVCRVVCDSVDDTVCPDPMTCEDRGEGEFRCVYQELAAQGTADKDIFERCTPGDCLPEFGCLIVGHAEEGFCMPRCTDRKGCEQVDAGESKVDCSKPHGLCNVECAELGATCPGDLSCVMNGTREPLGEISCQAN